MFNGRDIINSHSNPVAFATKLNARTATELVAGAAAYVAGTAQVETATIAGTITTAGNVSVVVTASGMIGSPKTILVPVLVDDNASAIATKIRTALNADIALKTLYTVGGTTTSVVLTAINKVANDSTLNIAVADGTSVGVTTAASSANTTAGDAGTIGAVTLSDVPKEIIAVFAIVASSGAFATKALLDATTDYTVSGNKLICVTNQSANKLLVIYQ